MNKNFLLLALSLLLAGCDQKAFLQKFVPKEDDAFARHFIEVVRVGDYAAAQQMLDFTASGDGAVKGLQELHEVIARGEPVTVETIGWNVLVMQDKRRTNLSYQIHSSETWSVGNVYLERKGDTSFVLASRFQPVSDSLEVLNRFSLRGKSPMHYAVLAACIAVPIFILYTLVVCIRSRVRRKWLWIIFILFAVFRLRLDWTSGRFDLQPISISLFGASAFRAGPYASWILCCAVPLGAIIFLLRRRKLLLPDAAQGT